MYWSEWQALTPAQKDQEIRETFGFNPGEHVNSQDHEEYISTFVEDDPPSKKGGKKTRRRRRQNKKKTRKSKTRRGKKSRKTRTKRK